MTPEPSNPPLANMQAASVTASPAPSPAPASGEQVQQKDDGALMKLTNRWSLEPVGSLTERYDNIIIRRDEGMNDPSASVIIKVGDNQFNAPAKQLILNSSFFRTKIHYLSSLKQIPVIKLDVPNVHVVELFVEWVKGRTALRMGGIIDLHHFSYEFLFLCFILGDNIQALPFQNDIMDVITAKLVAGHALEPCLPELAYSCHPGSPIRRVLVDAYARDGGPKLLQAEEARQFLNLDFLIDVNCALLTNRDREYLAGSRPYTEGPHHCGRYHDHSLEGGGHCAGRKFDLAPKQSPAAQQADSTQASPILGECLFTDLFDSAAVPPARNESPSDELLAAQLRAEAERQSHADLERPSLDHPGLPTPVSSASSNRVRREENVRAIPGPNFTAQQHINSGMQMSALASFSTPQSAVKRKAAAKTPRKANSPEAVVKHEPETPCPPSSKRRKMLQKSGATMDKPIELD